MAKSKQLPELPSIGIVLRAGLKEPSEAAYLKQIGHLVSATERWSLVPAVERVISVPESQHGSFVKRSLGSTLHGFRFSSRPDGLNFADSQQYNEKQLINNPGWLVLCDADFGVAQVENPQATYRLTTEQWTAEFISASRLALYNGVKMWGFAYRQTQGYFQGRQGVDSSVGTRRESGFSVSSVIHDRKPFGFFIRNLLVFSPSAKGIWGGVPLLEDLYRSLSEYSINAKSLGRYYSTRVRFPDDRTNKDYHKSMDWLKGKDKITLDFPSLIPNLKAIFKERK